MVWLRRLVLTSVVAVAATLAWSATALATVHSTLTLTGGKPSVPTPLSLDSFSWGIHSGSGTGGYSGRAHVKSPSVSGGEFSVTMASDKSGVKFALNDAGGSAFTTATVSLTHVPASTPYLQSVFHDVQVVSVSVGSTGGGAVPDMDLTFSYRSVEIEYAAESDCSLASRSWEGLSHVTPAVDPATGGVATDPLQTFLPVQLGTGGPGAVNVSDPTQADTLLNANGANGLSNLRAQTLATRLNVVSGALDPALVSSQLTQADTLLGAHKPSTWGSLDPGTQDQVNQLVDQFKSTDVPAAGCPMVPAGTTLVGAQTFALAGLVTDACTGAPVKGLSVSVMAAGDPGPVNLPTHSSEFGIPSIPDGIYELFVHGDGHHDLTLSGVQIAAAQAPITGVINGGTDIAVAMAPTSGCAPGATEPGPIQIPALNGNLFDQCSLRALSGGTANLVPPAGGTLPTVMVENGFTLDQLAAGTYGLSESAPGHQQILYTGGTLPAVQMPAQPSLLPDGSGARFGIIVVADPAPVGAAC